MVNGPNFLHSKGVDMHHSYLKIFFYVIGFVVLVSIACGPNTVGDPTATSVLKVQEEEPEADLPDVPDEPEIIPTNTTAPTFTTAPRPTNTTAPPEEEVEEPEEDVPLAYFTEEFDGDLSSWSWFLMSEGDDNWDLYTEDGYLVFDLPGEYQWVYVLYEEYSYPEVRIDILADNRGKNTNSVSLICNYSDEEGWYEFNITNGGKYTLSAYFEQDGEYKFLADGGSVNIRTGRDENWYTAICRGNQLELYINGILEKEFTDRKYNLKEGLVGLSVSSFDVLPILVEIDYFSISLP